MYNNANNDGTVNGTKVAELMDDQVNRYSSSESHAFKFVELTGLQGNTRQVNTVTVDTNFLLNKDKTPFTSSKLELKKSSIIYLKIPKKVLRHIDWKKYPKYIPVGTRFEVSFQDGEITKPVITGIIEDINSVNQDKEAITPENNISIYGNVSLTGGVDV